MGNLIGMRDKKKKKESNTLAKETTDNQYKLSHSS